MIDRAFIWVVGMIPEWLRAGVDRVLRLYYYSKGWVFFMNPMDPDIVVLHGGLNYAFSSQLATLSDVEREYVFDDIEKDDVVLDIGANIGGFSLPASLMAHKVYAVEPLYADVLKHNIALNNIENVTVFDCGIGSGTRETLSYGERTKKVFCPPIKKILDSIGGCDFLKIDCEGPEWALTVDDFKQVRRRIEGELHLFNGEDEAVFWRLLKSAGFEVEFSVRNSSSRIFHCRRSC